MQAHRFVFAVLLVAGAANAAFREEPPSSLKLIEARSRPTLQWTRASLLAQAPSRPATPEAQEEFSPPPLLNAPGGDTQGARPPPKESPRAQREPGAPQQNPDALGIPVDPYAGTFVGSEVAIGALMVFAVDVLTVVGTVAVALAAFATTDSTSAVIITVLAAGVAMLVNLIVAPIAAALGAYWTAPKEGNNGLFGAILGAYLAQAITVVAYIGASFGLGLLTAATQGGSSVNPVASVASVLIGIVFLALHWVGLPMAASFGIHWGGAVNQQGRSLVPENRRRPLALPTRPHEWLDQVTQPRTSPVVTFTF